MAESSVIWLRVAAGLYSLGLIDAIITVVRRRERLFRVALGAFGVGALFQLVSIVELGLAQGQCPVSDIYETMSFCAFILTAAFLGINWRYEKAASLSVFIFPLVFVMTLVGALRSPVSTWNNPVIRNAWLITHIVFSLLGYAALLFTAAAAIVYLVQERQLKRRSVTAIYRFLPPLGTLDELISRSLGAGFAFITIGIILGCIWAFVEMGTRWIGDTSIAISFVTWGVYLALVFFRVSAGWRGRKTAILSIVALCFCLLTWVEHAQLRRLVQ